MTRQLIKVFLLRVLVVSTWGLGLTVGAVSYQLLESRSTCTPVVVWRVGPCVEGACIVRTSRREHGFHPSPVQVGESTCLERIKKTWP